MTDTPDDPLPRALAALASAQSPDLPPAVSEALREASDAILEAMQEREAFVAVTNGSMRLIEVLDEYEGAIEDGNEEQIATLAKAGAEAEDALVDALNELHTLITHGADLSNEAAYLAALDQFSDDEEPRQ